MQVLFLCLEFLSAYRVSLLKNTRRRHTCRSQQDLSHTCTLALCLECNDNYNDYITTHHYDMMMKMLTIIVMVIIMMLIIIKYFIIWPGLRKKGHKDIAKSVDPEGRLAAALETRRLIRANTVLRPS